MIQWYYNLESFSFLISSLLFAYNHNIIINLNFICLNYNQSPNCNSSPNPLNSITETYNPILLTQ